MSTEFHGRQGRAHFPAAPSAAGLFRGATIATLLAVIAFLLPGAPAAQAQTITRLELVTQSGGTVLHRWSDDSGATWSAWSNLGAPSGHALAGTAAVVSDGLGRLNIFARADNGLWQIRFDGKWSAWTRVPGPTDALTFCAELCYGGPSSSPAVASWGPGRLDLFVHGNVTDLSGSDESVSAALLHTFADNSTWSGKWEVVGTGLMQGAPGAVSSKPNHIDAFVQGALGTSDVDRMTFDSGAWNFGRRWEADGGTPTSPPVAAATEPDLVAFFTRGTDGHLWGNWAHGAFTMTWFDQGCCLAGDAAVWNSAAAASPAPDTLDVFVIGTQHDLYRKTYNATSAAPTSGTWSGWIFLDHLLDYTNIAATAWTGTRGHLPTK